MDPHAVGVGLPPLKAHEQRVQHGGSPKDSQGAVPRRESSFLL